MKTMMIGINYNTDGTRYIDCLSYCAYIDMIEIKERASKWNKCFDEVYIIDFDPSHKDFIQEIVLHGCRM